MKIVDQALAILQKVFPSLTLKSFLQKIQPIVEQYRNLQPEEIRIKVLEYIKNEQPFGEAIAEGAKSALGEDTIPQEEKEEIIKQITEGQYGKVGQDSAEVFSFPQTIIQESIGTGQIETETPLAQ